MAYSVIYIIRNTIILALYNQLRNFATYGWTILEKIIYLRKR